MPEPNPDRNGDDTAWVIIPTRFGVEELSAFCRELPRILRINSQWEFASWQPVGSDHYRFRILNLSNGLQWETELRVETTPDGCRLRYADGLKCATTFRVEPDAGGETKLVIEDDYSCVPEAERNARLGEVDTSLPRWGEDLYRYLRMWKRWSWLPPWRWYMRRVWEPMKPSARRITNMIVFITLMEFVVFVMFVGFFILDLDSVLY